jgi:hypothetical protein
MTPFNALRINTLLLTGLLLGGVQPAVLADEIGTEVNGASEWLFRVYLNDREIGEHAFRLRQEDGLQRMDIQADFEVKLLFVTAYDYDHDTVEFWNGGCLQEIQAQTDDNGKQYAVAGRDTGPVFELTRNDEQAVLEQPCVKTFAYWDRSILQAERLLNAQTGLFEPVDIEAGGLERIELAGLPVDAERYTIRTPDGEIRLWYHAVDGQWLALEAPREKGRVIRYEPVSVPGVADRRVALDGSGARRLASPGGG